MHTLTGSRHTYSRLDETSLQNRTPSRTRRSPCVCVCVCVYTHVGRDSSVGTATCYGLDGPGIESWLGRYFSHPSRPAVGPTQPPIQWVPGLTGGRTAGAWRWPPPPSSVEVKERIEPYLWTFVASSRVNFTSLYLYIYIYTCSLSYAFSTIKSGVPGSMV